jgi:hypothetical protein
MLKNRCSSLEERNRTIFKIRLTQPNLLTQLKFTVPNLLTQLKFTVPNLDLLSKSRLNSK